MRKRVVVLEFTASYVQTIQLMRNADRSRGQKKNLGSTYSDLTNQACDLDLMD